MKMLVITLVVFCMGCNQLPIRPKPENIEGMNVVSIKGELDYGYSLNELWLMKDRRKISMAGTGAANNGVYDYQEGMTLQDFIALAGGDSNCTSGADIGVKRILKHGFFAIGDVALDGHIKPGDTVYINCIGNFKTINH